MAREEFDGFFIKVKKNSKHTITESKEIMIMKKPTSIQIKAMKYIKEHNVDELIYVKQHFELFELSCDENKDTLFNGDSFYHTFDWTHKNAIIKKEGWNSPAFDWSIDGTTVKALHSRGILIPSILKDGKYGEYPIAYKINTEIFNEYINKFCR